MTVTVVNIDIRAAREMAARMSFPFMDLEEYIVHKIGCSLSEIRKGEGDVAFDAIVSEAVRDIVTMRQVTGEDLLFRIMPETLDILPIRTLLEEHTQGV